MGQFFALTGRNLKMYFRDRGSIFFSLLSMFIVIALMVFFLGDMNIDDITSALAQFPDRDLETDKNNANLLVFVWTCAGIISINAVTVTLAAYSIMIKDKVTGKINSIYTSPMSRVWIAGGYIASAWLSSVIVCILTLFIIETIGVTKGLEWFSIEVHVKLFGMIMVNSFTYAAFMYLLALIAKTEGAWSGIGTVIGTLVGFFGGIYIPIGALSETIGNIMKCTPVIYGTALFREVMTKDILHKTFDGVTSEVTTEYCEIMGIRLSVLGCQMEIWQELLILVLCGILFLSLSVGILKYGKKTDR